MMQAEPFVFSRLTSSPAQTSRCKKHNEKQEFSELEYLEVSSDMITLRKKKMKIKKAS